MKIGEKIEVTGRVSGLPGCEFFLLVEEILFEKHIISFIEV